MHNFCYEIFYDFVGGATVEFSCGKSEDLVVTSVPFSLNVGKR